jgi:hypothetical protein
MILAPGKHAPPPGFVEPFVRRQMRSQSNDLAEPAHGPTGALEPAFYAREHKSAEVLQWSREGGYEDRCWGADRQPAIPS